MPDGSVVRHAHAHEGATDLHYGQGPRTHTRPA